MVIYMGLLVAASYCSKKLLLNEWWWYVTSKYKLALRHLKSSGNWRIEIKFFCALTGNTLYSNRTTQLIVSKQEYTITCNMRIIYFLDAFQIVLQRILLDRTNVKVIFKMYVFVLIWHSLGSILLFLLKMDRE